MYISSCIMCTLFYGELIKFTYFLACNLMYFVEYLVCTCAEQSKTLINDQLYAPPLSLLLFISNYFIHIRV